MMTHSMNGASQNSPLLLDHWKPVEGWDRYEVSCTGHIRRVGKPAALAGAITRKGYKMVLLYRDGAKKSVCVHVVVAKHFVGDRPSGLVVNHKDGVKRNNRASNFEYITSLENTRHAMAIGTYKPGSYQSKLAESDILEIRSLLSAGVYTTEIAKLFGIDNSAVSRIQTGKAFGKIGVVGQPNPHRGNRHHAAVLSEQDILEIRSLRGKLKGVEIAQRFGISATHVSEIQLRKSWMHVA